MTEDQRKARNQQRMGELHPRFASRVRHIIAQLEDQGLRPRIQDAYRSPSQQRLAVEAGRSQAATSFHNLTDADGNPEALAVDLLDDMSPLNPSVRYVVALARAAREVRCQTGIAWGVTDEKVKEAIRRAVGGGTIDPRLVTVKSIGWDPTHVEPADVTLSQARKGERPKS